MIVPDTNLLVYAYDSSSRFHTRAAAWWEACLSGIEQVGLPWVVTLAYLRLSTHPNLSSRAPMKICVEAVQAWLAQPNVRILTPGPRHAEILLSLIIHNKVIGNRTTDAHIAALCIEYGAVLHTNDSDFDRFESLKRHNPLA